MGTNCAPLVAGLFLFCHERDFMMSLSGDKQAVIIDAFNITSRYLDDILNINNMSHYGHDLGKPALMTLRTLCKIHLKSTKNKKFDKFLYCLKAYQVDSGRQLAMISD